MNSSKEDAFTARWTRDADSDWVASRLICNRSDLSDKTNVLLHVFILSYLILSSARVLSPWLSTLLQGTSTSTRYSRLLVYSQLCINLCVSDQMLLHNQRRIQDIPEGRRQPKRVGANLLFGQNLSKIAWNAVADPRAKLYVAPPCPASAMSEINFTM